VTPEEALKFLGFLALVEELDEEEEEWYEYYVTAQGGYFGTEFFPEESAIYYSQSPDMEDEVIAEFQAEFERPDVLYGYVQTRQGPVLQTITEENISVDAPRRVPESEVDQSHIL
tara:strand:- start:236 stop:580 length:345 start_codon:yes stop_codon:yes gene_type:complete